MPGGPRGLQNRCRSRKRWVEVGSIPILSAVSFSIFDFRFSIGRKDAPLKSISACRRRGHLASSIEKGGESDVA